MMFLGGFLVTFTCLGMNDIISGGGLAPAPPVASDALGMNDYERTETKIFF